MRTIRTIWTGTICLLLARGASAQIELEQVYNAIPASLDGPVLVQLAPDEHKYLVQDRANGNFDLYNLDHTPFLLDMNGGIPLYQEPFLYEPVLISRSLFDCDDTTIEFAVATVFPTEGASFKVVRIDGTVLFSLDGATLPYCFGCAVGTRVDRGVLSTEAGTKMLLFYNTLGGSQQVYQVYSLCGELPDGIWEYGKGGPVSIWPNPGSDRYNVEVSGAMVGDVHRYTVHDASGRTITSGSSSTGTWQLDAIGLGLPTGTLYIRVTDGLGTSTSKFTHGR